MDRVAQICKNVEKNRDLIFAAHDYIWAHAETGFREWKTSAYLEEAYEKLGYVLTKAGNIPGFYTDVDTGRPGPKVLVLGEMDCLVIPAHPDAHPETHYVHACGHHAQSAALLGIAAALKEPGALDGLCGSIRLMAVPAEELTELDHRESLRQQGVIRYFGGKQEFLARGYMDGVDMAFMFHTGRGKKAFGSPNLGDNGNMMKTVEFLGKATHSGYSPELGVNALSAAALGMEAVHSVRETFPDKDYVRVQMDGITGDSVSSTMEIKLRAATMEALQRVNRQVNRALAGAAAAMGAGLRITDRPGYSPLHNDQTLCGVFCKAAAILDPENTYAPGTSWSAACTDLGDLSGLMPVIHPYCSGTTTRAHTAEYRIENVEKACVMSAKGQLVLLELLLENDAAEAKRVLANYQPLYGSLEEYLTDMERLAADREAVRTNEDGTVTLDF